MEDEQALSEFGLNHYARTLPLGAICILTCPCDSEHTHYANYVCGYSVTGSQFSLSMAAAAGGSFFSSTSRVCCASSEQPQSPVPGGTAGGEIWVSADFEFIVPVPGTLSIVSAHLALRALPDGYAVAAGSWGAGVVGDLYTLNNDCDVLSYDGQHNIPISPGTYTFSVSFRHAAGVGTKLPGECREIDQENLWSDADMYVFLRFYPDGSCEGDANGSGRVDVADLATLLASFGAKREDLPCSIPPCYNPDVDFNGNGSIDTGDMAILLSNWGPCQ